MPSPSGAEADGGGEKSFCYYLFIFKSMYIIVKQFCFQKHFLLSSCSLKLMAKPLIKTEGGEISRTNGFVCHILNLDYGRQAKNISIIGNLLHLLTAVNKCFVC